MSDRKFYLFLANTMLQWQYLVINTFFSNVIFSDKMKTRNIILSGVFALALVMLFTQVRASTIGQEAAPGNIAPRIYMIDSSYDICGDAKYDGSRPDGFNLQDAGCLNLPGDYRFEQYAFTGESLEYKVVVRDLNGAADISYAKMTVAGMTEALCVPDNSVCAEGKCKDQIPAWETADAGFHGAGATATDKGFKCTLTVEPLWYGPNSVNIAAWDQVGAVSTMSIAQSWFFNPAIMLDLSTNDPAHTKIVYEQGYPGQTVMSLNKLVVTNLAEGGVDLWTFIAATDLTDPSHSGALCPESNVLNVDQSCGASDCKHNMDFRCKIGTQENDQWTGIENKNNVAGCDQAGCFGALPLLTNYPNPLSIIGNGKSAECQFRLHYPVPCIGNFSDGLIQIIVKAV